jgi:transposase
MAEDKKRRNARPKNSPQVVRAVLYDVKYSSMTLTQIAEKYRIASASTISRWVRKYSSEFETMSNFPLKTDQPSVDGQLHKSLEEARMRIICLETMIDIAEKELNVAIRKKPGTKQ